MVTSPLNDSCRKVYEAHEAAFKAVFAAVHEGQTLPDKRDRITRATYSADLDNLVNAGLLAVGDVLIPAQKHPQRPVLERDADGRMVIRIGTETFSSPSAAGKAITGSSTNGWVFFRLQAADGADKGLLRELRDRYLEDVRKKEPLTDADDDRDNSV